MRCSSTKRCPNGGTGVAATQVSLIGVEGDPFTGNWEIDGYLICADPLPGQQVLSASTSPPSSSDKGTVVSCGSQVATGGTSELLSGEGEVVLASDYSADKFTATVRGENNDGTTSGWSVKVYGFCADA